MLKIMNPKWTVALAAAFASITMGLSSASAVLIVPPGNSIPVPTTPSSVDPTLTAANFATFPFMAPAFTSSVPNTFSGFLNQYVFQESAVVNPLLGLTFAYQIDSNLTNAPALDQTINSLGIASFSRATFQNANYGIPPGQLSGGTISDTVAGDGTNVLFTFPGTGLAGGDVSSWLFVRTNAPAFGLGTATISGFGTATAPAFVPVPEPTTVLFGLALFGVVGCGRRRS